MNVWALDDAEPTASHAKPKKKTTFADEVEATSSGWESAAPPQRRKQRGSAELVVEDEDAGDEDGRGRISKVPNAGARSSRGAAVETRRERGKVDEITSADVVGAVDGGEDTRKATAASDSEPNRQLPLQKLLQDTSLEASLYHLVRGFLLLHNYEEVVQLLDRERERADKRKSRDKKTPNSAQRQKPVLNVITRDLSRDLDLTAEAVTPTEQAQGDFNCLNHPGSTPKPQGHRATIGEPGSTPMARAKDLRKMGFDDIDDDDDDDDDTANTPSSTEEPAREGTGDKNGSAAEISEYAIRKRASRVEPKHVQLGDPGRTPTKEYIFFRETPPSFVTETIEEAVDVLSKLGNDPVFLGQAVAIERFVELQSSEVSKYTIGQQVVKLGAHHDVNGMVAKIYGSRLCGTAGPGTIVVDTCPEEGPTSEE
ncbi:hypothetical protein BBJ28_00005002 [Nothophytophthora sp. Chile5]|nr:hypothetical protein BBJ28_00005002 [Nothophytophthora sp. Chile5]